VGFNPEKQEWFNICKLTNRTKDQKNAITEEAFDKSCHLFMIKISEQIRYRMNIS
jgi:hypothetical protein